ncbi:hypothetical protein L210DRAFT_3431350 [Boletus edulis BED1]|uniref:Uncharacterized protein n=1 Tax=Boletus edulis BED1 TaxID=1328754 RepID=A0AAD4BB19_BOLED|nr:hypothetical protein L210DRAFT_3431350 [Boletus edulis BED1]
MTTHKSQGLTLPQAIVDLEGCKGTESPYVLLSRVKSLDGLLILRPFSFKRITCRPSEDARKETRRLQILHLMTIMMYGTPIERLKAEHELSGLTGGVIRSITVASSKLKGGLPSASNSTLVDSLNDVQNAIDHHCNTQEGGTSTGTSHKSPLKRRVTRKDVGISKRPRTN